MLYYYYINKSIMKKNLIKIRLLFCRCAQGFIGKFCEVKLLDADAMGKGKAMSFDKIKFHI